MNKANTKAVSEIVHYSLHSLTYLCLCVVTSVSCCVVRITLLKCLQTIPQCNLKIGDQGMVTIQALTAKTCTAFGTDL